MLCQSVTFTSQHSARTYAIASTLPSLILDSLLNLPHLLTSLRNRLLPVPPPAVLPHIPQEPPAPVAGFQRRPLAEREATILGNASAPAPVDSDSEHHGDISSETGSEADVESNEGSGVGESWVSLKTDRS